MNTIMAILMLIFETTIIMFPLVILTKLIVFPCVMVVSEKVYYVLEEYVDMSLLQQD